MGIWGVDGELLSLSTGMAMIRASAAICYMYVFLI